MPDYPMHLSVEDAVDALARALPAPRTVTVPLEAAYGLTLAADLRATVDHPSLSDSALDGIACRVEDTLRASDEQPVLLELVGEVAAGTVFGGKIARGQAVRIYTGAPVPEGADGIVPVERLHGHRDHMVSVLQPARASDIRARGSDFQRGEVGLERGTLLGAAALALAAAMGHPTLEVFQPLRVGILSTGDEVHEPGQPLPPGGVYNSNRYGLEAKVRALGHEAVVLPRSVDRIEALQAALAGLPPLDLLLTSGGVSMGKYDLVRDLLIGQGQALPDQGVLFWKVQLRPGGPAMLGRFGGLTVFGLPGNPVSSLLVFEVIAKPALMRRLERRDAPHRTMRARAETPFKAVEGKRAYWRATLEFEDGAPTVRDFRDQRSSVLRSLTDTNALVVLEPGQAAAVGDMVQVIWL